MSETRRADGDPELTTYRDVQLSPDFSELRRRFRRFVFPMTGLFLVWYFLYVLLAAYAPDFMSHKVAGNITVALLFGLGQFVVDVRDHDDLRPLGRQARSTRTPRELRHQIEGADQ